MSNIEYSSHQNVVSNTGLEPPYFSIFKINVDGLGIYREAIRLKAWVLMFHDSWVIEEWTLVWRFSLSTQIDLYFNNTTNTSPNFHCFFSL